MTGLLKIRTTKAFGESTVSKILELVENSSSRKSPARTSSPSLPVSTPRRVLQRPGAGGATAGDPSVGRPGRPVGAVGLPRPDASLVTSCPLRPGGQHPLSFFAGIGGASREGVLVKGSNYLETLSQVKTVVFDKTGTLTEGRVRGHCRPPQRYGGA